MEIKSGAEVKGEIRVDKFWIDENIPYESKTVHNTWLLTGWDEILKLIAGLSVNYFNTANTVCGIGDDSTAANSAQTDLIAATNKTYIAADSGTPTETAQALTYTFTFGTAYANYAWNEVVIKNSVSTICWDRAVPGTLGTKTSAEIWKITAVLGKA